MIHFSLSTEDADLVMRALMIQARIEKSFGRGKRQSDSTKRTRRVVSGAVRFGTHVQTQSATQRIEETHTKEGI